MILTELENKDYIHDLQDKYEIMFCPIELVDELVHFIDTYWRKNHIFVLSRELLDWQHLDKENGRYNFVVAIHRDSNKIHSILGFVPTYQFDSDIESAQIWPCIWKVIEGLNVKGLGISLYHFLANNIDIETISILGISEVALSIYKKWGFSTGKIEHFYILNELCDSFSLVESVDSFEKVKYPSGKDYAFCACSLEEFMQLPDDLFETVSKYKSRKYYVNRFFNHPLYKYQAYIIENSYEIKAVFFCRGCNVGDKKAIRIVDFIGNTNALIGNYQRFQKILCDHGAEYIDFINVGLDKECLEKGGFQNKQKTKAVIPNYFEPFLLTNVDLDYAFKSINPQQEKVFYKADADQDRPNSI